MSDNDTTGNDTTGSTGADAGTTAEKDPQDWTTGDEPPTGPQLSYLSTLAREAGVDVPDDLTKASASQLIDDLQSRTGRGQSDSESGSAS